MAYNEIDNDKITQYILFLRNNKNVNDISINTYLRGIRTFTNFLIEDELINNRTKVTLVKANKKIKETYTDEELMKLLVKPNIKKEGFSTYRNWVIVCYFLGTGNGISTVCNLEIGDIDFSEHEIKLKQVKNKKQYIIPLSTDLERTLREYLEIRKGDTEDCSKE